MPQALPIAAAAIAKAAVAVGVPAAIAKTAAVLAVKVAVNVALSTAVALATAPKVDAAGSPIDWASNPNAPIPILFGEMDTGGNIVRRKAFGDENMYQGVIGVISAAGPIESIGAVLIENATITFDPVTQQAGAPYGDKLWFSSQLGEQPEASWLQSPAGLRGGVTWPGWTSSHQLSGKAAYMATFGHDSKQKIWKRGDLPKFRLRCEGQLAYDPREDSTYPGGAGSHLADDASTWTYTTNPVLCALKWARGLWEGSNGGVPHSGDTLVAGMGLQDDEIDFASFVAGANLADALGWALTARPTTDDDKWEVLKALLQAGGCAPIHIDGILTCIQVAASKSSVATLERGDILGSIRFARSPSRLERHNAVYPRYRSAAHNYDMVTADVVDRATYLTEDGGVLRSRELPLPYVPDVEQAGVLAAYWLADGREGFVGGMQVKPHLRGVLPGQCFTMPTTHDLGPLSGQKLYLLSRRFDTETGILTWGFRAETDSKHAWAGGIVGTVSDPITPQPPPSDLAAPDALLWGLSSPAGGTLLVAGAEDNPAAEFLIVDYRLDGASDWTAWTEVSADAELVPITGLAAGDYEVQLRWRADNTGAPGAALVLGPETVTGPVIDWPDQPPPDPGVTDGWNLLRRIGGGVFTGDLAATEGATWGVDVAGRPAELTDGRIVAALDASGDLLRDITIARANSSNLARRTGGGVLDTLADLDTTANTKLAGIAAGATVGSARGSFANETAAIAATLYDGDTFYDQDKAVQKAKVGGSIVRVSPLAVYGRDLSQADTDANYSAAMPGTAVYSLTLPSTTDADEFEARIHLTLQTGSPHTRASAATAASVPVLWELWCVPPSAPAFKVHDGAFTAEVRIPGGGTASAREIIAWDGDLSVNGYSSFGDEFAFPESGVHVLELRLHSQTSGNNLLDFTAAIEAKVFHFS